MFERFLQNGSIRKKLRLINLMTIGGAFLIAILLLSGLVVKLAKDYNAQRAAGKLPSFDAREYPEIRSRLEPGIWD